ncbi:MAG: hypothetical protein J07HQW1_02897 [Haloquadratum walsbyi J07HQW1]|uniref:Uncharacterized protein n=1 Tax=Haloquadratum walsbyi J07HQW1 TaxID=1238424 RepID=U1N8K2_9EURY|nr:MAG: hypothetical protein J07HQW1_02897 [Haloquadratum walsbyi J07HQW1]
MSDGRDVTPTPGRARESGAESKSETKPDANPDADTDADADADASADTNRELYSEVTSQSSTDDDDFSTKMQTETRLRPRPIERTPISRLMPAVTRLI